MVEFSTMKQLKIKIPLDNKIIASAMILSLSIRIGREMFEIDKILEDGIFETKRRSANVSNFNPPCRLPDDIFARQPESVFSCFERDLIFFRIVAGGYDLNFRFGHIEHLMSSDSVPTANGNQVQKILDREICLRMSFSDWCHHYFPLVFNRLALATGLYKKNLITYHNKFSIYSQLAIIAHFEGFVKLIIKIP